MLTRRLLLLSTTPTISVPTGTPLYSWWLCLLTKQHTIAYSTSSDEVSFGITKVLEDVATSVTTRHLATIFTSASWSITITLNYDSFRHKPIGLSRYVFSMLFSTLFASKKYDDGPLWLAALLHRERRQTWEPCNNLRELQGDELTLFLINLNTAFLALGLKLSSIWRCSS